MLDNIKEILSTSWNQIVRVGLSVGAPAVGMPMVMEGTDWTQAALAGFVGLLMGHLRLGLQPTVGK